MGEETERLKLAGGVDLCLYLDLSDSRGCASENDTTYK